jgi:kelch-like protein 18
MEEMRRLGKLCDITLASQDHRFTAHRIVLAASIPYFNAMFLNDLIESRQEVVTIDTIEPSVLEQLINYSYNGKITITNENVQPLLVAANFFQMDTIKQANCDFIKKRLCKQDALCLKSLAEHLMCHDLLVPVNRFLNLNFTSIAQSPEFLKLGFAELSDLVQRDEIYVHREEQVS